MQSKEYTRNDYIIILLISLASGIILYLVETTVLTHYYFHKHDEHFLNLFALSDVVIRVLTSFVIALLLFLLNFEILNAFPELAGTKIRVFIISPVLTFILCNLLYHFFDHLLLKNSGIEMYLEEIMIISPLKYLFLTVVVVFSSNIININKHRKNILLENEKLRAESLQSRYDALRNQINPHFLFNSLNALNLQIKENPESAVIYVEQLSSVLRYTLKSSEENLVPLSDEIDFIKSYIQLLKTRYEENLEISININDKYLTGKIPPLSMQLLIENAVKHNIISKASPLKIHIASTEDKSIIVKNNLAPKLTAEERSGTGLTNLAQRYLLASGKEIQIRKDSQTFSVEIPIIDKI